MLTPLPHGSENTLLSVSQPINRPQSPKSPGTDRGNFSSSTASSRNPVNTSISASKPTSVRNSASTDPDEENHLIDAEWERIYFEKNRLKKQDDGFENEIKRLNVDINLLNQGHSNEYEINRIENWKRDFDARSERAIEDKRRLLYDIDLVNQRTKFFNSRWGQTRQPKTITNIQFFANNVRLEPLAYDPLDRPNSATQGGAWETDEDNVLLEQQRAPTSPQNQRAGLGRGRGGGGGGGVPLQGSRLPPPDYKEYSATPSYNPTRGGSPQSPKTRSGILTGGGGGGATSTVMYKPSAAAGGGEGNYNSAIFQSTTTVPGTGSPTGPVSPKVTKKTLTTRAGVTARNTPAGTSRFAKPQPFDVFAAPMPSDDPDEESALIDDEWRRVEKERARLQKEDERQDEEMARINADIELYHRQHVKTIKLNDLETWKARVMEKDGLMAREKRHLLYAVELLNDRSARFNKVFTDRPLKMTRTYEYILNDAPLTALPYDVYGPNTNQFVASARYNNSALNTITTLSYEPAPPPEQYLDEGDDGAVPSDPLPVRVPVPAAMSSSPVRTFGASFGGPSAISPTAPSSSSLYSSTTYNNAYTSPATSPKMRSQAAAKTSTPSSTYNVSTSGATFVASNSATNAQLDYLRNQRLRK